MCFLRGFVLLIEKMSILDINVVVANQNKGNEYSTVHLHEYRSSKFQSKHCLRCIIKMFPQAGDYGQ